VLDRALAQVRVHASLDDGEEALVVAVERLRLRETLRVTLEPALGELERFLCIVVVGVARATLV
jgi:hypothetical protein